MKSWTENGCRLAWLIDPVDMKAHIYTRAGKQNIVNDFKSTLDGEVVLPGFELDLSKLL